MNPKYMEAADLLAENRMTVSKSMPFEMTQIYPACAVCYLKSKKRTTKEEVKSAKKTLNSKINVFSSLRGTMKPVTVCKLDASGRAEELVDEIKEAYASLKKEFKIPNSFLAMAAEIMAEFVKPQDYDDVSKKARDVMEKMEKKHPWLTDFNDEVYAMLLAISGVDSQTIVDSADECYVALKKHFSVRDSLQALSFILALMDGKNEDKCKKVVELYDTFKARKYRFGQQFQLPTLGMLALIDEDVNTIVDEVIEVCDYLRTKKGFGSFYMWKRERLMYATMIVAQERLSEKDSDTLGSALISSALALVIAEEIAMCCIIASSSASASSSGSSN